MTHVAIGRSTIRFARFGNDPFDGYMTIDEGVDPDLLAQFDAAEEAIRGRSAWSSGPMDRYECDDALATGAARFRDQVDQVRILSPDKRHRASASSATASCSSTGSATPCSTKKD